MKLEWMLDMLKEARESICDKCAERDFCKGVDGHCSGIDGILAVEHYIRKQIEVKK